MTPVRRGAIGPEEVRRGRRAGTAAGRPRRDAATCEDDQRPGKIRLHEAVERLVQLYEATDKKDEAAKWRKELEARKNPDSPP